MSVKLSLKLITSSKFDLKICGFLNFNVDFLGQDSKLLLK